MPPAELWAETWALFVAWSPRATSWLLTYLVHSTALLAGVLLVTRWMRSDLWRDVLWKTALVGGVVTASLQQALPPSPIGSRLVVAAQPAPAAPPAAVVDRGRPAPVAPLADPATSFELQSSEAIASPAGRTPLTAIAAALWLAIAGVLSLGLLWNRVRLASQLGPRRPITDAALHAMLADLRRVTGIRRRVTLTGTTLSSPIALGYRRILLPGAAVTDLEPEQQRGLLAHELGHLARFDPFWLLLAGLIERVFFFQPLNRVARQRMQVTAEYLCDEWAVGRAGSGIGLARCLVKVAEWLDTSPATTPVAGMAEDRSHLVNRVRRLIEERSMSIRPRTRWMLPVAAGMVGLTVLAVPGFTAARAALADPPAALPILQPDRAAQRSAEESPADEAATRTAERAALPTELRIQAQRPDTDAVVTGLIAALSDPDVGVRRAVVRALGNYRDARAVPGLRNALADQDAEVREGAIEALSELKDRRITGNLIDALRDPSPQVRRAAARALAELETPDAVEPLIGALSDGDAEVRQQAADALGDLGDRRAVPGLIKALSDEKADVRHEAAESLGQLGDPSAAAALAAALSDASPDVRSAAIEAIGDLELERLPAAVIGALRDANADVRHAATHAVGRHRDARAVPNLKPLLEDASADVREGAIEALADIRTAEALEIIVAALKSPDPNVRKMAAEALGRN